MRYLKRKKLAAKAKKQAKARLAAKSLSTAGVTASATSLFRATRKAAFFVNAAKQNLFTAPFRPEKLLIIHKSQNKGIVDFIDGFALFTRFPQARFGEQAVHINSLSVRRF